MAVVNRVFVVQVRQAGRTCLAGGVSLLILTRTARGCPSRRLRRLLVPPGCLRLCTPRIATCEWRGGIQDVATTKYAAPLTALV